MTTIKSDPTLLAEVRKYGDFDTNACYQCGSCTVICDLASDSASFPRRTLRYILFGLKKLLLGSLDPWLCYFCGDCSTTCPRETEPGEAMMTLRRYLTAQYDWTGISSKIFRSKAWHIGALFLVGAFVLLLVGLYHIYTVGLAFPDFASEPMGLEHMFDKITIFTLSVFFIPLFFLISNAFRMYWFTMKKDKKVKIPFFLYLTEAKTLILHAVTQKRFRDCPDKKRWIKHLLLVAGCALMVLIKIFFLKWFQTDSIYPIYHPQRLLGYLAAGALLFATGEILIGRIKKREQIHKFSDLADWTLPVLLLLTALSGIAIHIFRYFGLELATHYAYALHLVVVVPMLVVEIPFGKFSHIVYRPLAVYFQAVKEKALQQQVPGGAVLENV
jgi:ferredoxin